MNRRADVYRLGSYLSRSRLCLPSVVDGVVRVCRGGIAPLRLAFPGGANEAAVAASQGNNFSWSLPRPFGLLLWHQWRDQGEGDLQANPLYRSPGPVSRHLCQMAVLLAFLFLKVVGQAVGVVDGGRLDQAQLSLGGGGHQWRTQI